MSYLETTLGKLPTPVFRLGLSASYRPGKSTIHKAIDEGVNYFFLYGFDTQMISVLRDVMPRNREKYVVAAGAYNYIWGSQDLRKTLEKRLRQLRTDYIDVFHFLGVMKPREFTDRVRGQIEELRQDPRVRALSMSCHDRKFAAKLAGDGTLDAIMIRYNAAHRGAEQDIFPHVAKPGPGIVSYTATRWRYLLRRPRGWLKDGAVPTAGMCYRFALSNPSVDVCLTAPSNLKQFQANLAEVRRGPLAEDEMKFMREFGDAVYRRGQWFM